MTKKINLFAKYGSDTNKEINGVPFFIDEESNCYIRVARWCARNTEHLVEQAELTKSLVGLTDREMEEKRLPVFVKHLVKGWSGIYDKDGNELPFTVENAVSLFEQLPDLANEVVGFSLNRANYPIDGLEVISKN